jgi:DNA-binding NarL/FixJ family response regulator
MAARTASRERQRGQREVGAVVLVDDQPLWLDALERALVGAGIEVTGTARTADAAVALVEEKQPDGLVVSLEVASAGLGTAEFVRRVRERAHDLRIVVLSTMRDSLVAAAVTAAGADAWTPKTVEGTELVAAVRETLERPARRDGSSRARELRSEHQNGAAGLTCRETEILSLVASGFTNAEIAERLWVTKFTVKFHLANAYRKLGVSNRTQAARYMFDHGLPTLPLDRSA